MDAQAPDSQPQGIAVVGMAGRFPQARDIAEFWDNLSSGRECLTEFSEAEIVAAGTPPDSLSEKRVRSRGVLQGAACFDAGFFGYSPREAEVMDPQQRVFLELAWEALENAGYDPERAPGPIGVFAGAGINTYFLNNVSARPDILETFGRFPAVLLNEKDFVATRAAYKLNLRGPAISVQTACSTSLVAICNACQSLLNYECDMALAGAAAAVFPQCHSFVHEEGGMIAPDGHCRPFDERASGTLFSDGVGLVVLRRLDEALQAGDHVLAVIKGFAVNNDGADKAGFTAPSVNGQADVIRMAQEFGDTPPDSISYIEAHGTATPLGDPIEVAALTQAFRKGTDKTQFCGIGSVKSNIGHLDVAAGIAGFIKTVLALQHGRIPPTLHFQEPNPSIDFETSPFYVVDELTEWRHADGPRRAGVSSFGIGGTNAHVVLEEAPACDASASDPRGGHLLVLSAKTPAALDAATSNLRTYLEDAPEANLGDVAFTLQQGRREFSERRTLVCRDVADAVAALEQGDSRRIATGAAREGGTPVVFMFPGQGSQRVGVGRELYATERVFRETVDHCAEVLRPLLDLDLRRLLFPEPDGERRAQELLNQTRFTQPALFAQEIALARLWLSWGVEPAAMIGHSVGEYVAACLADVFSLEDGLQLISERGRLIQQQPRGAMLAILQPADEMTSWVREPLSMAAVNAPSLCVASGPEEAVDALESDLAREDIPTRRLQTSHAFHSSMMEPVMAPFAETLAGVSFHAPTTPYISNVTASWVTEDDVVDPHYWNRHLRQTVRFAEGADRLLQGDYAFLELGPGATLTTLVRQQSRATAECTITASLPASKDRSTEWEGVLLALGRLWQTGVAVDWRGFHGDEKRRRTPLPSYPFERRRYWIEPGAPRALASESAPDREPAAKNGSRTGRRRVAAQNGAAAGPASRDASLRELLREKLEELSGRSRRTFSDSTTFPELGLDSLLLAQFSRVIEKTFGVRVGPKQLSGKDANLQTLAGYLAEHLPEPAADRRGESAAAAPDDAVRAAAAETPAEADRLAALQTELDLLSARVETMSQVIVGETPEKRNGHATNGHTGNGHTANGHDLP